MTHSIIYVPDMHFLMEESLDRNMQELAIRSNSRVDVLFCNNNKVG